MCGLVGMAGFIGEPQKKMMKKLLLLDQFRGEHSTGVMCVGLNAKDGVEESIIVEKEIGCPNNLWQFRSSELFDPRGMVKKPTRILMGHNRFATVGGITKETAHPFEIGNVIGAHNGTIESADQMDLNGFFDFEVDSQMLFQHISDRGIDDAWAQLGDRSAAALTWYDKETKKLNFIRNYHRPLHFATSTATGTLFWASEAWMLEVAASSAKIKLSGKPVSLDVHTLFSVVVDDSKVNNHEERKVAKKKVVPVKTLPGFRPQGGTKIAQQANWSEGSTQSPKSSRGVELYVDGIGSSATHGNFVSAVDGEGNIYHICYPEGIKYQSIADNMVDNYAVLTTVTRTRTRKNGVQCIFIDNVDELYMDNVDRPKDKSNIVDIKNFQVAEEGTVKTYQSRVMSREEYESSLAIRKGCRCCGDPVTWDEREEIEWLTPNKVACVRCKTDEAMIQIAINN